jgi:repressor LexA
MLTRRQSEILDFIQKCFRENGQSPTVGEIQAQFGFSSPTTVSDHLRLLERKGAVRREAGKSRNIQLVGRHQPRPVLRVPLIGAIAAGFPEIADEERESALEIDATSFGVSPRAKLFALRVRGDSMIDAFICDGDTVILEAGQDPADGDIVAALIDGESTLKRFLRKRGRPFLRAENRNYPDLIPARELTIQGVFRALIRTARQ